MTLPTPRPLQLPALPTGHTIGCGAFNGEKLFTAEQMRRYAALAAAAERKRWAVLRQRLGTELSSLRPSRQADRKAGRQA